MAQAIVMDREAREVFQKESPLYPSSLPPPPAMEVLSPLPETGGFVVLGVRPVAAAPHSSLLTYISAVHQVLPARTPHLLPLMLNGQKQVWD